MATNNAPADLKQRLKDTYDAIAPTYNEWTIAHSEQRLHYLDKLLALLDEQISTKSSFLELGCGAGIPVTEKLLQRENLHVTANDLSPVQIDTARANLKAYGNRLTLKEGDMLELDFADATFDAVIAMYSIIHLPQGEQEQMFGKIARWLKPGGCLLMNVDAAAHDGKIMEKWLADNDWVYWSGFGAEGTLTKIKDVGLRVVVNKVEGDAKDPSSFLWIIARKE